MNTSDNLGAEAGYVPFFHYCVYFRELVRDRVPKSGDWYADAENLYLISRQGLLAAESPIPEDAERAASCAATAVVLMEKYFAYLDSRHHREYFERLAAAGLVSGGAARPPAIEFQSKHSDEAPPLRKAN